MASALRSCFGIYGSDDNDPDTEALLPRYEDDTTMQRRLRQKMHSYLMFRALSKGYMPTTEQLIVNLRTLLASDVLNPRNPGLGDSGRLLARYSKQWLTDFIELIRHKNDADQIQDFIWHLAHSKVTVDTDHISRVAASSRAKADASASKFSFENDEARQLADVPGTAYQSFRTIGSLLLTNPDFRIFLGDLNVVARQIFADTAFTFSNVAEDVAKKIEPSQDDKQTLKHPDADSGTPPSGEQLGNEAAELSKVVVNGLARTGQEAAKSLQENVSGDTKETLLHRLKQVVKRLRGRQDYSDSVSTIATLLQRYAKIYSRAVDSTIGTLQDDVGTNQELDHAVKNFWSLVSSFGKREEWDELEKRFNDVMKHSQNDPQFEKLMTDIGNFIQKLLTDPNSFDTANEKIENLRGKWQESGGESSLRQDIRGFLEQVQRTFSSVAEDPDIRKLTDDTLKMVNVISPPGQAANAELFDDFLHVFLPLVLRTIQYIPIPRLEVSVPELDLLLENLILEPGKTVNDSSFLPFRLKVETYNDLEVRKARYRTATRVTSLFRIKADGISLRADDVGFWLRTHTGLLRLADEGIASFHMDERGMDIHLDVEVMREKLEKVLTLRAVRVKIHKLNYVLRKSKFSFLSWIFKPILRPIIRKIMERQVGKAIEAGIHVANRELVFARERLRATRISDPQDLRTYFKAILARLTPEDDPDVYTSVGIHPPTKGVFAGRYTPGSVVKIWNEEGRWAGEIVDDHADRGEGGWKNEIFDVQVQQPSMTTTMTNTVTGRTDRTRP
ncbi:MAG: hypothetical protein M1816_007545 [Peltula sp. TS41687]|nr:MAG: hypothetical protein M1816_007545 [Peltula sp. TS41687]